MRISELADLAGVSRRTIDYYTQMGLIHEEARSPGKHRLYSEDALKSIKVIKELQKQHYTLEEINSLLNGNRGENDDLFEKLVDLQKHFDTLQKEIVEICPRLQFAGQDSQLQAASRELVNRGLQVMQVLMLLLGDL